MRLSKTTIGAGVGAIAVAGVAVGMILAGNSHAAAPQQIVVRQDAATSAISTTAPASASAVAKPASVAARTTVAVKRPATVQETTVTDDPSTGPVDTPVVTSPESAPSTASTDTAVVQTDPPTTDPNGVVHAPAPTGSVQATPSH